MFGRDELSCANAKAGSVAPLSKKRIGATALAVADRNGFSGFTIRAVAKSLGVTPMALYHHVKNKAEMAALVVNITANENPPAVPTGNWRNDLWSMAQWMRDSARRHPAVQELRRSYRIYTPDIIRMADLWLTLWQHSGLDAENAFIAATTSSMAIGGLVGEELSYRELDVPDEAMVKRSPNARALLGAEPNHEMMFELAVRSLIDGLHDRLMKKHAERRRKPKLKKALSKRKAKGM